MCKYSIQNFTMCLRSGIDYCTFQKRYNNDPSRQLILCAMNAKTIVITVFIFTITVKGICMELSREHRSVFQHCGNWLWEKTKGIWLLFHLYYSYFEIDNKMPWCGRMQIVRTITMFTPWALNSWTAIEKIFFLRSILIAKPAFSRVSLANQRYCHIVDRRKKANTNEFTEMVLQRQSEEGLCHMDFFPLPSFICPLLGNPFVMLGNLAKFQILSFLAFLVFLLFFFLLSSDLGIVARLWMQQVSFSCVTKMFKREKMTVEL